MRSSHRWEKLFHAPVAGLPPRAAPGLRCIAGKGRDPRQNRCPGSLPRTPAKAPTGPAVDRLAADLETLSRQIHDNPELCYQEVKAAAWLVEFLDKQGFKVERGLAGI